MSHEFERMRADHEEGVLTIELLLASPYGPSEERLNDEILRLCRMIAAAAPGERQDALCNAFKALMWARSPDGFEAPSEYIS
jgi:hypothetical protein